MRCRSAVVATMVMVGVSLLGCGGGSDRSAPRPEPPATTAPVGTVPEGTLQEGTADGSLSDAEIADIEQALDEIDDLLDDLDTELRAD